MKGNSVANSTFHGRICCWFKRCFFQLFPGGLRTPESKSGLRGVTLVKEERSLSKAENGDQEV